MKHYKALASAIALTFLLMPTVSRADAHKIVFDKLELDISESETAQIFHIVDQLSQWDQYTHKQYVRWAAKSLSLDDDDRRFLQRHVELRQRHGWGQGLEQAFLVDKSLDTAARDAIKDGLLTEAEAKSERDILFHFAPKLAPLIRQQKPAQDRFIQQLDDDHGRLAPTVAQLLAFCQIKSNIVVPVFLVANPDVKDGGGEANGGRLVVEAPSPDPRSFLLHEALHALLVSHQQEIEDAAKSSGLDPEDLNEAVAYAFAPGLTDDGTSDDSLADEVVRLQRRGAKPTDSYLLFNSMAIVIRPVLRQSLRDHETFGKFLPKAVQKWRATVSPSP